MTSPGARTLIPVAAALVLAATGTVLVGVGTGRAGPPAPSGAVTSRTAATGPEQASIPAAGSVTGPSGAGSDDAGPDGSGPDGSGPDGSGPAGSVVSPSGSPGPSGLARSAPVRLDIPAIGVRTRVVPVGLQPDGTVEVPPLGAGSPAGWYRYLASPGEPGPAVILGHVDSARDGPAVFYRLGALHPGDAVSVSRADGSAVRFRVTAVADYPKTAFPTQAVYGAVARPVLRLVTCGGRFDAARHEYVDNIVVFAELDTSATAA